MRRRHTCGFSLLEVVIVVAIIAILAAIGIPRMSRGSAGAADSALRADLAVLRNGIDLYSAEHQGTLPTVANFVDEMTAYTDINGGRSATKIGNFYFGPYVRSMPAVPVGPNKGKATSAVVADLATVAVGTAGSGWLYNATTGKIIANADENDAAGTAYSSY